MGETEIIFFFAIPLQKYNLKQNMRDLLLLSNSKGTTRVNGINFITLKLIFKIISHFLFSGKEDLCLSSINYHN